MAANPFPAIRDHVLLPWANGIAEIDAESRRLLPEMRLKEILDGVPDAWLSPEPEQRRREYLHYFSQRLLGASLFVEEAIRARAKLL